MEQIPLFLPQPRQLETTGGKYPLPDLALIALDGPNIQDLWFTGRQVQAALQRAGVQWEIVAGWAAPQKETGLVISVVPGSQQHPEGYSLTITPERIYIVAHQAAGAFYGVQTLCQLLLQAGRDLPTLQCTDYPDYPNRGVMLDISRDRVPTMETLYMLVDHLAAWKINQVQFYLEHTYAYRNHPVVWEHASPMTSEQILALDAYCKERFIELVPNQNSFGHMRPWLVHQAYRPLAEAPDGCDTVWGHFDEPFTLYPGEPGSFELIQSMYDELLPNFSSRQFNVGCDETVDLGQGRSASLVKEIGAGRVYLDFLLKIYRSVKARGLTMQFWGDVIMNHPELIPELPRDAIALEWGYEADHAFDEHGKLFAASGVPFYVCPGTASWNSVVGRVETAMGNLVNAAVNGRKHGAVGYLITDWGDNGHWQPLPASYLGLAFGSALAWTITESQILASQFLAGQTGEMPLLARALDLFVFQDSAGIVGKTWYELGKVQELVPLRIHNNSLYFRLLKGSPEEIALHKHHADEVIAQLRASLVGLDEVMQPLANARMTAPDADLVERELRWGADMLRHACRRGIWVLEKVQGKARPTEQDWLYQDAGRLIAEYETLWHARSRPGGFRESVARLNIMRSHYE